MADDPASLGIEPDVKAPELAAVGTQLHSDPSIHDQLSLQSAVVVSADEYVDVFQLAQDEFVLVVEEMAQDDDHVGPPVHLLHDRGQGLPTRGPALHGPDCSGLMRDGSRGVTAPTTAIATLPARRTVAG